MKTFFENPEMELHKFQVEDVITTSFEEGSGEDVEEPV
jgi:hypothetical protein